jgi:nucleoside-diphosphate-sugar epimerase
MYNLVTGGTGFLGSHLIEALLARMAVELFATDQSFPIEKAWDTLGYQPSVEFKAGMKQVENWLRQSGAL